MKQDLTLELYNLGRQIQHSNYNPGASTTSRFEKALDALQDELFPESKHKIKLKGDTDLFYLMGERLVQMGENNKSVRWVMRNDLKGLKPGQIKHIPLFVGNRSSYPIEAEFYNATKVLSIGIGCISFGTEATKQILKWLKEKPKNGQKRNR